MRHDDFVLTETSRLQRHFERAATVDGLTGLRNRRWLEDFFARQLTRSMREARPVSLLIIDVDDFRSVNERHGHLIGDAVLCRVAQVLAMRLRPQDLLARYGGDEFALLLPDTDIDEAVTIGDRLCTSLVATSKEPQHDPLPPTTLSIGVGTARLSDSLSALLSVADAALYRAKHGGKNRGVPVAARGTARRRHSSDRLPLFRGGFRSSEPYFSLLSRGHAMTQLLTPATIRRVVRVVHALALVVGAALVVAPHASIAQTPPKAPAKAATATDLPPLIDRELFFGNPEIAGAAISPDGKYIAFLKP